MDRRRSSHIVSEIYEATIDATHWDYVVTMIAKLTRSNAACLYYINKEMEIASSIAQYGLPEDQRISFGNQCDSLDRMISSNNDTKTEEPDCIQFTPAVTE